MSRLPIDADELASCVSCGLCLPHCPTWRVTGEESASPRGRIAAMRAVDAGAPMDADFTQFMDLCLQCRGCEAACPSSVPFGRLMEGAREALVAQGGYQPHRRRVAYRLLGHHRLLLALSSAAALAQRARLVPRAASRRFGLPPLPVRREPLTATGTDVWLFTGCVMDAWLRPTHQAALDLISQAGAGVALPGPRAACCGALHRHAGLVAAARRLATRTIEAMPGDNPILVDSAGCGAALKEYGELLRTDEARRFSSRIIDVNEWLADRVDALPPPRRSQGRVAVQDPCHLRHVQRRHLPVRTLLAPYAEVVELDDEGLCCGAGGAYSALHPDLAADIRRRKLDAVERTGAPVVASANPGCALWLSAAGIIARHPVDIVAAAIRGDERGG